MINITVGICVFIVYGTFIVLYFLLNRKRNTRAYRAAYIHCIVCWSLCLIAFTLLPAKTGAGLNFIPFVNFLKKAEDGRAFELIHFLNYIFAAFLNVCLFAPFGIFCAVYARLNCVGKPLLKAFLLGAAVSIGIEFLQWALPVQRLADIDHVIYNALGACVGAAIFGLIQHRPFFNRFLKAMRLSNDVDEILS